MDSFIQYSASIRGMPVTPYILNTVRGSEEMITRKSRQGSCLQGAPRLVGDADTEGEMRTQPPQPDVGPQRLLPGGGNAGLSLKDSQR